MKLKSLLRSLDRNALEEIQRFWELTPAPGENTPDPGNSGDGAPRMKRSQWVDHLYPRLQNASHFHAAFERLSKLERDLLSFLAVHGGNMEEKELRKRFFAGNLAEMKETVQTLGKRSFLFVERWKELDGKPRVYGMPEPFLRLVDLPHFWRGYLGALLRQTSMKQLHNIASNGLAIRPVPNKRDHLIHEIRQALVDPGRLRAYIDSLPNCQRKAFFLLLQRRGVCLHRELLSMIQARFPDLNRGEAIEGLLESSGVLFQSDDNPSKYENLLRIPREIYYIITHHFVRDVRGLDDLDSIGHVDPGQQPKTIYDNGISILRDTVIFLGYIERHDVRRLGNGGIGKNDLKKILGRLSAHKTLKYTQFLAFYCIKKKFLVPEGDRWGVSERFHRKLKNSRAFYVDLYTTWLKTNEWNEEFIDGDCVHTDHAPTNLVNIIELRQLVLDNLAKIPFDTWIDGSRFIESLLAQIEVRIPHRGGQGFMEKNNRINYLVIESVLCEAAYWLGLISLGLHESTQFSELGNRHQADAANNGNGNGGGPVNLTNRLDRHYNFNPRPFLPDAYQFHFQINGLGRSILAVDARNPEKALSAAGKVALPFRDGMVHFTVLPNFDVVAPPDLNLRTFFQLRQFAEIRHIDVMSTLAITQNSIRAGMEHGFRGEDIIAFLEAGCPNGLPETVRHLINECGNRYGELTIGYAGGYILVDDPVLREDLLNNKTLKPSIKNVKGERVILLNRSAEVPQVAKDLKQMGFMPSVDNENVYTSSEGRLRFSLTPDDLGVLMALLRFVTHVEKDLKVNLTDEKTLSLLNTLRPTNQAHLNIEHYISVLSSRFEKSFQGALKKKLDSVASKYRRQMREFLARKSASRETNRYPDANPATATRDVRKLLRFAIENESSVQIKYKRNTNEEVLDAIQPESLNGDKLFAFSDQEQSYCAYRIKRILSVQLD